MAGQAKPKKIPASIAKYLPVKDGELYEALHRVGDDPVKMEVEKTLKKLLDKETFDLVVAVFKAYTDDSF